MQRSEYEHKLEKERNLQEEKRMEQEFRAKMMEKYAYEQRLEQLTQLRRRQKEIEHKQEVSIMTG